MCSFFPGSRKRARIALTSTDAHHAWTDESDVLFSHGASSAPSDVDGLNWQDSQENWDDPEENEFELWASVAVENNGAPGGTNEMEDDVYDDASDTWDGVVFEEAMEELNWESFREFLVSDEHNVAPGMGYEATYFLEHLDEEVYDGAGQSLRQWLITRVTEKVNHNTTDAHFEDMLKREAAELMTFQKKKNVRIPTSLYMVRKILGVKDLWELDYHVCPCEGHFWQPLSPKLWLAPSMEGAEGPLYTCPECEGPRFEQRMQPNGSIQVVPMLVSSLW